MYADEIRRAVEASSRLTLPTVTALLWRAYGEGKVTDAEAEALSALIEARQVKSETVSHLRPPIPGSGTGILKFEDTPQDRQRRPRTGTGSRPRTDASLERRRRWAASGRLPPALASRFTLAEQAVLALIAAETARRGDCRLAIEHLATVAGVSRSTVKAAIREARKLGLLTVEERRVTSYRNDTNVVRIISPEWTAWLRLARRSPISGDGLLLTPERKGGGVKFATTTPTQISEQGKTRPRHVRKSRIAVPISPSRVGSRKAGA